MSMTRRELLAAGAGTAAAAMLPVMAQATPEEAEALIKEFAGGTMPEEGGVELDAPEIAENGNTVPVGFDAPGAVSVMLVATGNPNPEVATFTFGPLAGAQRAKTRIRLARTQDVIAVAKMADGSARMARRTVKVTIGGCGG